MKKLIILISLSFLSLSCFANTEEKIVEFIKKSSRTDITFEYIKVKSKLALEKEWGAYLVEIKLKNNPRAIEDIFFTDGVYVSQSLINIDTLTDIRLVATENFSKKLDTSYYKDSNLIYGEKNSKNKVVIFSDPLCPVCINYFDTLSKNMDKVKDTAVYYYSFPLLQLHPTSEILVKATFLYEQIHNKKIYFDLYKKLINNNVYQKALSSKENALKVFNEIFNTKFTLDEINMDSKINERFNKEIVAAENLSVRGTPTVYFNETPDFKRNKIFNKE